MTYLLKGLDYHVIYQIIYQIKAKFVLYSLIISNIISFVNGRKWEIKIKT